MSDITYEVRTMAMQVNPVGEPSYSEYATRVEIDDDTDGEFVYVKQDGGTVRIDPDEWGALRVAIDQLIACCRGPK